MFNFRFFLRISWEYFSLIQTQSSILLHKFKPFHYVMYFMPLLSVLIINLFNIELYSNMINPRRHWCQDLDCFINSYQGFCTLKTIPSKDVMEKREEWQFKEILSKLENFAGYGNRYVNCLIVY